MPPIGRKPLKIVSPYKRHVADWRDCAKCDLVDGRTRVVFARGKIPCDILFVGEAPGKSEDIIGQPFVGPAGKLLDRIIASTIGNTALCSVCGSAQFETLSGPVCRNGHGGDEGVPIKVCFYNLVSCIPVNEDNEKAGPPKDECIQACRKKVVEFINIAKPRYIFAVGSLSSTYLGSYKELDEYPIGDLLHPAFILRANVANQGLLIQQQNARICGVLKDM